MNRPQLCLTLTGTSIQENYELVEKYKSEIDMVELRVDLLSSISTKDIGDFPAKIDFPCILTIRRTVDGGKYSDSEENRKLLFCKIFSECGIKTFSYVDFEDNFYDENLTAHVSALNIKVIRSMHDFKNPVLNIVEKVNELSKNNEIPKIAFMPSSLSDVTNLFIEAKKINKEHILLAMGPYGIPSRILAAKLGNLLTFSSPANPELQSLAHIDPIKMNAVYNFRNITTQTKVFGITGFPLAATSSPELHNAGYKKNNLDAVYIPVKAENIEEALAFNEVTGITGMSVTIPHKQKVIPFLKEITDEAKNIEACNTIVKKSDGWYGYNTDAPGFSKSLLEFTGLKDLTGKKIAIIGAGGASCAVIYAVYKLGGKACIFNRTVSKAEVLAKKYGFEYAELSENSIQKLKEYSDIIIQTTSKGMKSDEPANPENDPIFFYDFNGSEMVFDIVYVPEVTPIMARAEKAGCKTINGFDMLRYQGYEQFNLFTGKDY